MTADILSEVRGPWAVRAAGWTVVGTLAAVLLGATVHIATVILVPRYADNDVWSRLTRVAGAEQFVEFDWTDLPGLDPLFAHAACQVVIGEAPVRIAFAASEPFWSLGIYDPSGTILFSLNDRTAAEGELDLLVASPIQAVQIKENPPQDIERIIVVETASAAITALVRFYAPDARAKSQVRAIIEAAECDPAPLLGAEEG